MDLAALFFIAIFGCITGAVGSYIADQKGRSKGEGFALGFFFSVIGLIIEGLLPSNSKPKDDLQSLRKSWEAQKFAKVDTRMIPFDNSEETKKFPVERPTKKCPFCAEMILEEAIICRFCQHDLQKTEIA